MASPDQTLLWVLGVLVTFLTLLVGAIYMSVVKNQDKTDKHLDDESKDLWFEINRLKERVSECDASHRVLCQKHEDAMDELQSDVAEHKNDIYKWRSLLTEARSALENRIALLEKSTEARISGAEKSIKVIAGICNELKNGK